MTNPKLDQHRTSVGRRRKGIERTAFRLYDVVRSSRDGPAIIRALDEFMAAMNALLPERKAKE